MTPLLLLLAAGDWHRISVPKANIVIDMPSMPQHSQMLDTSGALFTKYESETAQGEFGAAISLLTPEMQKQILDIREHGTREELGYVVSGTMSNAMNAFAKVRNMRVKSPKFLLSNGLPAEFATVTGAGEILEMHIYFSLKALIMVHAPSNSACSAHFWGSLKLPKE